MHVCAALDKAAEARQKVQALERFRQQHTLEPLAPELAFAVGVQLAGSYAAAGLDQEALELYQALVRGKAVTHAGRLRANMGNIHFRQGRLPAAIKCFRMALDQLPPSCPRPRAALLRNIGVAFARMGRYSDAASSWEAAMQAARNHQVRLWLIIACRMPHGIDDSANCLLHAAAGTDWRLLGHTTEQLALMLQSAYNLVVCCHALGDKEGMRDAFVRLLQASELAWRAVRGHSACQSAGQGCGERQYMPHLR
jgi:tetratricopeptide (TPR) repeat protein